MTAPAITSILRFRASCLPVFMLANSECPRPCLSPISTVTSRKEISVFKHFVDKLRLLGSNPGGHCVCVLCGNPTPNESYCGSCESDCEVADALSAGEGGFPACGDADESL